MKISIIICTKDRKTDLFRAIKSIENQSRKPDEIVIVDASTNQDFRKELIETFKDLNISYLHMEPGLTKQRNRGIKVSTGDVVLFLDDDVVLESNYLAQIENLFIADNNKLVGGAMGRIINIDNRSLKFRMYQLFAKVFLLTSEGNGKIKLSGLPTHPFTVRYSRPVEVEVLSGAQMAYRREVFKKNLFDEVLQGYCYMEDVDFSYRVSKEFKLVYEPRALIKHMASPSNRLLRREKKKMFVLNHYYLFRKNCHPSLIKWIAFGWSQVGQLILGIFLFDGKSLLGMLDAWRDIIKQSLTRRR